MTERTLEQEAISVMRLRHAAKGDPLDEYPDDVLTRWPEAKYVALEITQRRLTRAIRDALPAGIRVRRWVRRWFRD